MVKIKKDDLEKLLKISALKVDEGERKVLLKQLSETLKYVENLEEVNIEGVEPAYFSATSEKNQVFSDGQKNTRRLDRKTALSLAKRSTSKYFKVKRIF